MMANGKPVSTKNQREYRAGPSFNFFATGYEDSDGFLFSRVPSKKSKPSVEPVSEVSHSDVENAPPKSTPRRGRPPKKRAAEDASAVLTQGTTTELPTRRPTRGAAKSKNAEPAPQTENNTRSSRNDETPNAPEAKKAKRGRPGRSKNEPNGFKSPEQPPAGTKIALPAADTPVIQRNKELRGAKSDKGRRRSSLGMRGRRASSLIDSGASNGRQTRGFLLKRYSKLIIARIALPHREVGAADFYKHIADDGLPEPRRMRQLLIWCATRAMGDKPSGSHSEDQSTRLAGNGSALSWRNTDTDLKLARVIQEELLKDFSTNSDLSNWFSREDVSPPTVVVKKPNPRNVQNTDKIKELEDQIQR